MIGFKKCCVVVAVVTLAAVGLRIGKLVQRPMHGDEAIHAVKFGELLDEGEYRYDPEEYHGPTLNYLSLIPAYLSGAKNITEVSEAMLRIVPVFFGVLLVLLLLLLADGLGVGVIIVSAVLTAVSTAMVFYSRYYIQEMLLVCFTFGAIGCGWRYSKSKKLGWILCAAGFAGLMHATKETCIIAFGAILIALVTVLLIERKENGGGIKISQMIRPSHLISAVIFGLAVSAVFYSSFFSNAGGIVDSFTAYGTYFKRATENQLHIHPWHYYLKMLLYSRYGDGPIWSEGLIVILACIGFVTAMRKKTLNGVNQGHVRFIAFYTLIMTVVYSAIPYKTPWSMLGFLHGMILLAGVGAIWLVKSPRAVWVRAGIGIVIAAATIQLAYQAYIGSYKYFASPANPYVYAHPTEDITAIVERIREVAKIHPDGNAMYIQVICPEGDYWPLPWYLRDFTNIGWWERIDKNVKAAPMVIAAASLEVDVVKMLYESGQPGQRELYVPLFDEIMQLRPGKELRGYVTKTLWDSYQQR